MSRDAVHSTSTLPLARPDVTSHDRERAPGVLRSGRLSRGSTLETFETEIADRCSTAQVVAVSTGTVAFRCIVSALDLASGAHAHDLRLSYNY